MSIMGVAWYIVAENPELQEKIYVNGKFIANHLDHLSVITTEHGCNKIEDYHSQPVEDLLDLIQLEMDDVAESIDPNKLPEVKWFSPEEGMQYVQKLVDLIKKDRNTSTTTKEELLSDLGEYLNVMEILIKNKCRWHFAIDF